VSAPRRKTSPLRNRSTKGRSSRPACGIVACVSCQCLATGSRARMRRLRRIEARLTPAACRVRAGRPAFQSAGRTHQLVRLLSHAGAGPFSPSKCAINRNEDTAADHASSLSSPPIRATPNSSPAASYDDSAAFSQPSWGLVRARQGRDRLRYGFARSNRGCGLSHHSHAFLGQRN
jgi:hypothetical protein